MLLYLMRHAEALPTGGDIREDSERPLSAYGKAQAKSAAQAMEARRARPNLILCSPLRRARETGQILADQFGAAEFETSPYLAPSCSLSGLHSILQKNIQHPSLLLIGHSPDVTLCLAFLTGLDTAHCPLFATASIAALQLSTPKGKASLLWFQTPDSIAQR